MQATVFVLLFTLTTALLFSKSEIRIKSNKSVEIGLKVLNLSFKIPKKKERSNNNQTTNKKDSTQYFKLIRLIPKYIKKLEIAIYKLEIPESEAAFSPSFVLSTYGKDVLIYTLISYVASSAKSFYISNEVYKDLHSNSFCLDLSIKFRLFFALPILFDLLVFRLKTIRKGRKKTCRKTKWAIL